MSVLVEAMENCHDGTSVNSMLLLKERLIKVETLLGKYACLATKFNDLEKSHSELAESEKNAKKDAARYLEKYCERSKKCLALLKKIKTVEKEVKEKTDLITKYQNELAKLDSILNIYKTEREDFLILRKDKDFLVSLVWKILKDNRLESKDNKNKKNVEIFLKRFERDLENLKLHDFDSRRLKKISKSQVDEVETSSFSVELPTLNSVESGFIDGDGTSESANCRSCEEVDSIEQRVPEFITKPDDKWISRESDIISITKMDNNHQSYLSLTGNGLFEPSNTEKCIKIQTEDFCFDVYSSINEDLTINDNIRKNEDGFSINSNLSTCPSAPQELFNTTELTEKSDVKINENCCDFDKKDFNFSKEVDNNKLNESEMKETLNKSSDCGQPRNCFTSNEGFDCNTTMKNPHSCSKQYKSMISKNLDNSSRMNDITNSGIKCSEFPQKIVNLNSNQTRENLKNSINESFDQKRDDTTEIKTTVNIEESSSLVSEEENNTSNYQIDVSRSENEKSEREKICQNLNVELDRISDEQCVKEKQEKSLELVGNEKKTQCLKRHYEEENVIKDPKVDNFKCIQNNEMSSKMKKSHLEKSVSLFDTEMENLSSAKCINEISDEKIFEILKSFRPVKLISPIKKIQRKENIKNDKLLLKSGEKHSSTTHSINNKLNIEIGKLKTIKETTLLSGNETLKKSLVDVSTQTSDVIIIENNSTERQRPERNVKSKKIASIRITKNFIKKVVKKILNSKLMKKLENLDEVTKFLKFQYCSNSHFNNELNRLNIHDLYHEKCKREILCSIFRNCLIKSRYKNKKKAVKKRLSSWKVEDSMEVDTVLSQSQYLSGFTGKNNLLENYPIYNDLTKVQNNKCVSPGQQSSSQNMDWMTNWRNDYNTSRKIFETTFTNSSPESVLREIALKTNFKEEDDGFGSLPIDNYSNFNKPVVLSNCDILDMKDKSLPIVHNDEPRLIIPENNDKDKSKFQYENNIGTEAESLDIQNYKSVPKRSSRFDGRNNGETLMNTSPISDSCSSSSVMNNLHIMNEICEKYNTSDFKFSEEIGHCQNSVLALEHSESIENTKENNKSILNNSSISESKKIIPQSFNQAEGKSDFSPKTPYNLRKKPIDNKIDKTFMSSNPKTGLLIKKAIRNMRNFRATDKLSTRMVEDSYYSGEENEKGETQTEEPEKKTEKPISRDEVNKPEVNVGMELCTPKSCSPLFITEKEMSERQPSSCNTFDKTSSWKNDPDYSKSGKSNDGKYGEVSIVSFKKDDEKRETEIAEPEKKQESISLLDSIMTAMTKQTEEFKPKKPMNKCRENDISEVNAIATLPSLGYCSTPFTTQNEMCKIPLSSCNAFDETSSWNNTSDCSDSKKSNIGQCDEVNISSPKIGNKLKRIIKKLLQNYLKGEYQTVAEMEAKMKPCLSAMNMANEYDISSIIVSEVMDNSHEELVNFERPAPPLTRTEHRLIVMLTVLPNTYKKFSEIFHTTLKIIWNKLFPDKFIYPDDEIEAASRFYAAICRKLNNFKGLWRFCFEAVSCMRQRWSIPIFVVFQVWPDILHNAKYVQGNLLVITFVNVILHTPKGENMRRKRQENKLLGIKHLLINFYEFEVNITIEELARQLYQAVHANAPGVIDALSFLAKCRQWTWNKKNIISPMIDNLNNWKEGNLTDQCGFTIMKIIRKISTLFPLDEDNETLPSAKNVISSLYQLLSLSETNPEKEKMIIKTLCTFGHHSGVKDFLSALLNKFSRHDPLHIEIKKAIETSDRKRKECIKNLKQMRKKEEKFRKKKEEEKRKKKKIKKKPKVKVVKPENIGSEIAT